MKRKYISIEKQTEVFEFYKRLWKAHGVEGIRADTMGGAISKIKEVEKYHELFFVCIVADDINFLPQLKMLREKTSAPILIAASKEHYSEKEHHEALSNGADFYGEYCVDPEQNITAVLSAITSINLRAAKHKSKSISCRDIHIADDYHKIFIRDTEIHLTSAEMKIFRYMMLHRGHVISHKELHDQMESTNRLSQNIIYSTMKRLRKKIRDAVQDDYLETVRGVGYRLRAE
jgi:DNA-binding response OmpR family regulator